MELFQQDPPRLGNQYDDDALLQEYLTRVLPPDLHRALLPELKELGDLGGHYFFDFQMADRLNEPKLTSWAPWGERVDHIELTPLWKEAQKLAAERGLVAIGYERKSGEYSRIHQFLANYLVQASLDIYSCPLAMTDGAAKTLVELKNKELMDRALPHLLARDPKAFWTSGQWMTERTGGSDVGLSRTVAKKTAEGWRLYGNKWFTSATTSEMALTLARPEGNGEGGRGLAMFYVETRDANGRLNGITINRLKEKMGTKKVPTAELDLNGTLATPVAELANGVRNITPMLTITRSWNAMGAAWGVRRAMALVKDFSNRRVAFGAQLAHKPLHVDTLASMQAESDAVFHLAFFNVHLLGRIEAGTATESEKLMHRLVTPLAKLTTGKQAMAVASEAAECWGGAGYMEDTGMPIVLRDAQVLPIWEGTTNVLSLDTLRAMAKEPTFDALSEGIEARLQRAKDPSLAAPVQAARSAMGHAREWIMGALSEQSVVEAGARRFALTLGRTLELSLMLEHAQWAIEKGQGKRAAAAARRFATNGVDLVASLSADDAAVLAK